MRQVATGLQSDSSSCGFWSILFAWCILLNVDIHEEEVCKLRVEDLKAMFEILWRGYTTGITGLSTEVVKNLFDPLEPSVEWDSLGPTVRLSRSFMAQAR